MNEILNPYIAGAPVVENSMFFGREDVFKWIERSLAGKFTDHILVLHGQRRVGKTSVLKQIPNFLPDHYIQVFFDLQGRTGTTLDRFLWWLASEIVRTLNKELSLNLPRPDRKTFEDTEYLINEFIPSLRQVLGEHVLLLTFDEFDSLDRPEIRELLANPLIAYLRRLIEMEGLNFIFSIGSSGDKLENMQASYTDFFKSALYRKISFLSTDDCQRLITKPVEGLIRYDRKAVEQIFKITSGHPYFTQLMCHELFSQCQKTGSREISAQDVENILGDVIERGTVNLKFVWDEASDLEKWVLAALAQMDGGSNQQLSEVLTTHRVRFSDSDLNSATIHLQDKDVLSKDNRFVIHLMRLWLVANRPIDRVREELVEVNPIANRYIEIGDEYRDRGQAQAAIESYQQALQVDPDNLKGQLNIAGLYLEQNDYPQAAAAFELALKIDDEDVSAKAGYCDANLALADAALARAETDKAISLYQAILVVNPAHSEARQQMAAIYQQRAESSLTAGQDDEALAAFNQALMFTPDDERLSARYDEILAEKKSKVIQSWLERAENALKTGNWQAVIQACEAYLALNEKDEHGIQAKLEQARKYAGLDANYEKAQQAMRDKHYGRAIELLQGIIAQDPSYKSTPRLLAEAVEANKTKDPVWRKPWFLGSIAAVVIVALGVMFGPQAWNAISAAIADRPAEATKATSTNSSQSVNPTPEDIEKYIWMEKAQPLMTWVDEITTTPPDFIEDFSISQPYWNDIEVSGGAWVSDYVSEGTLHIVEEPTESSYYVFRLPWKMWGDFVLQFDYSLNNFPYGSNLVITFRNDEPGSYIFTIRSDGQWDLWYNGQMGINELASGTSADLNPGHTNQFQVFAWQDKLAIFLDNKILTYAEDDHLSAGNLEITTKSYKPIDVTLDNIEVWNLSDLELYAAPPSEFNQAQSFYQPIREYLGGTLPSFQEDFETPQPYWEDIQLFGPEYSFTTLASQVLDGTLQINPTLAAVENGAPFTLQFPEMHGANIALQFDFRFNNPDPFNSVGVLNLRDPGDNFVLEGYSFYCDFYRDAGNIGCGLNTWSDVKESSEIQQHSIQMYKDPNSYFTMLMVYYNSQLAAFLDGYFIGYADGLELSEQKIIINTFSDESLEIEFDNFKFWNLEGVMFRSEEYILNEAEKIWNSIAELSPEREDFEVSRGYWNQMQVVFSDTKSVPLSELVVDGNLHLDAIENEDYGNFRLPFPGLQGSSFALQFDFQFTDPKNSGSILSAAIEAWGTSRTQEGYSSFCDFYPDSEQLGCGLYKLTEGSDIVQFPTWDRFFAGHLPFPDIEAPHTMFVVFYEHQFFSFLDGTLVAYTSGLELFDQMISINVGTDGYQKKFNALIDNIEFWNLDGVVFN